MGRCGIGVASLLNKQKICTPPQTSSLVEVGRAPSMRLQQQVRRRFLFRGRGRQKIIKWRTSDGYLILEEPFSFPIMMSTRWSLRFRYYSMMNNNDLQSDLGQER